VKRRRTPSPSGMRFPKRENPVMTNKEDLEESPFTLHLKSKAGV